MIDKKITKCTGRCGLDTSGKYCNGCGRTIEHITNWRNYSDDERKKVLGKKTSDYISFTKLRTINSPYV